MAPIQYGLTVPGTDHPVLARGGLAVSVDANPPALRDFVATAVPPRPEFGEFMDTMTRKICESFSGKPADLHVPIPVYADDKAIDAAAQCMDLTFHGVNTDGVFRAPTPADVQAHVGWPANADPFVSNDKYVPLNVPHQADLAVSTSFGAEPFITVRDRKVTIDWAKVREIAADGSKPPQDAAVAIADLVLAAFEAGRASTFTRFMDVPREPNRNAGDTWKPSDGYVERRKTASRLPAGYAVAKSDAPEGEA